MRTAYNKGLDRCTDCGRPTKVVRLAELGEPVLWPMCEPCHNELVETTDPGKIYIPIEEARLLLIKSKL